MHTFDKPLDDQKYLMYSLEIPTNGDDPTLELWYIPGSDFPDMDQTEKWTEVIKAKLIVAHRPVDPTSPLYRPWPPVLHATCRPEDSYLRIAKYPDGTVLIVGELGCGIDNELITAVLNNWIPEDISWLISRGALTLSQPRNWWHSLQVVGLTDLTARELADEAEAELAKRS